MGVERFELDKYGADFNFVSKRVLEKKMPAHILGLLKRPENTTSI